MVINLDALHWHTRPDVAIDAKDTWIHYPNGYSCHIIFRESTKISRGWQVTVVRGGQLIGAPIQHSDPAVIRSILRQVEGGTLFSHLDKNKHGEMLLAVEALLGRDERDIMRDIKNDLPVIEKMIKEPAKTLRIIDRAVARGKDPRDA
jgi:hypothetical protein